MGTAVIVVEKTGEIKSKTIPMRVRDAEIVTHAYFQGLMGIV